MKLIPICSKCAKDQTCPKLIGEMMLDENAHLPKAIVDSRIVDDLIGDLKKRKRGERHFVSS